LKAFEKAAATGVTVHDVVDTRPNAHGEPTAAGKELVLYAKRTE
jgi:hypothetical protein